MNEDIELAVAGCILGSSELIRARVPVRLQEIKLFR